MSRPIADSLDGPTVDWPWLRSFVAVMNAGSLTAAARSLRTTQPTVGRHIRSLERQLGETLFDRTPDGFVPTSRATELYERAAAVEQAVTGLAASLVTGTTELSGLVRVTTSQIFAIELLPYLLSDLLARHPSLQIELIASDEVRNLLRREADVAVRFIRPTQPEVIATKVGEASFGLFAHRDYLARAGRPRTARELGSQGHRLIGFEDTRATVEAVMRLGSEIDPSQVQLRSDTFLVHVAALRAACGIGACQLWLAARHPELERVLPKIEVSRIPIWIAAHDDLHRSRRIRAVFDHLVERLRQEFDNAGATPSRPKTGAPR